MHPADPDGCLGPGTVVKKGIYRRADHVNAYHSSRSGNVRIPLAVILQSASCSTEDHSAASWIKSDK